MIMKLKDERKTVRPRKWPDYVRPKGVWLDRVQANFRSHHIAASIMRGKTIDQIETLPNGMLWVRKKGVAVKAVEDLAYEHPIKDYTPPNWGTINAITLSCWIPDEERGPVDEDVRSDSEHAVKV